MNNLHHTVCWGVAVTGLFIAIAARLRPRETKPGSKPSRSELRGMMREVVREMLPELKN